MADSILRLRVDSTEYDSKIRRATQGIAALDEKVRKMGGTFEYAEQQDIAFVRQLGQMDTVSKNAKGKISELSNAIQELSIRYNSMSKAEQNSEFGKSMKTSIDQLKDRFSDLKGQMDAALPTTQKAGLSFKDLASKVGLPVKGLGAVGAALAAAGAAAKTAKDAFFANEMQLDEWGRVTESAKSLYAGFLDSLNNGGINGYLNRIDQIVTAARNAYDALDELNTFNAFNQVNVSKARQTFNEAIVNYREGKGTSEDVKTALAAYQNELRQRQERERSTYETAIAKKAAERGIDADALRIILEGSYSDYVAAKNVQMTGERQVFSAGGSGQYGGGAASVSIEKYAKTYSEKMGEALRQINDTEIQALQALGAQAFNTETEINQLERQALRYAGGSMGSVRRSSSTSSTAKNFIDAETAASISATAMQNNFAAAIQYMYANAGTAGPSGANGSMSGLNISSDVLNRSIEQAQEMQQRLEDMAKTTEDWGTALGAVGGAFDSIGDAIGGTAGKYVSWIGNTVSALGALLSSEWAKAMITQGSLPFPENLVAIASTVGAVTSAIASMPKFAAGGIVPGTSFSGDKVPAMVNSGELILNRAQQANLASQLGAADQPSVITAGEVIKIISAHRRRTGVSTEKLFA